MGYGFCDKPRNYIYDIEKLSLTLPYVVEPEGLIFAKDIKIDDDAIFVKTIPSAMTQMSNNSQGIWGMRCVSDLPHALIKCTERWQMETKLTGYKFNTSGVS